LELGDIQPSVNAIAAPVLDQNSYPIGFITVAGFFTEEVALELGPLVANAAKIISKETGHMILWQRADNKRQIT
jgi:DNA-binding IclR family transcriptional regulator